MRLGLVCLAASAALLCGPAYAAGDPAAPPPAENPTTAPPVDVPPEPTEPEAPKPPPAASRAPTQAIDLDQLETKDLSLLYFHPSETYLVPYIARAFHHSLEFQRRTFHWEPWDRTTVLLKDFSDYGNAAARASPNNALLFDIAPLSQTFETFSPGERFYTLANHENVHVATMDVWNRRDAAWRRFFHGKPMPLQEHPELILYNFLATPRVNVPRWYLEGSAVFMETWMAGGFGRAQGAYDEMVFRAKVRDDAKFYSPLGLEAEGVSVDFQVGVNDYLYGTRFVSYLGLTRSPQKVIEWLSRSEDSAAYYETQFKHVFGQLLDSAWQDWVKWEHDFQRANLASVGAFPLTPMTRLTPRALGSVSRTFFDPKTNSLVGAFRYPGVLAHVGELSLASGEVRRLTDIKGAMLYRVTSLAYDPDARRAFYTTDNYAFRDVMALDVDTGKTSMLIRDGRIGELVINPHDKALWGLRHLNGYVTLVRMAPPYTGWSQVRTFDYGTMLFDLDISPDGQLLSTSWGEINGDQSVRVFRLDDMAGEAPQPIAELKMGSSTPESFVFSPDGRFLFGSSYYTGVSNIFRFEVATQKMEAVSNASTGLFRPIPQPDGSLIAFEFTGEGFTPVRFDPKPLEDVGAIKFLGAEIAAQHPIVKTWAVGSPAGVPLDSMITRRGKYVPLREMRLAATYPILQGYRGAVAGGWHAIFEDPMQFSQLTLSLAWSPGQDLPKDERLHVAVEYRNINWRLRYLHNGADFYDLFGPTHRARRGDAFLVGYKNSLIYDPPRQLDFTADAALFTGLDTLPNAQNVPVGAGTIASARFGLEYENMYKSLGAVDHESGLRWEVVAGGDYADHEAYPRIRGGFDAGFPLASNHTSLWIYTAAGAAAGEKSNSLSRFYFGAFGNNYVDDREVKRYREFESFPGFDIDEVAARRFAKAVVELNLPPLRFENVGRPSLFLSNARTALFAGGMAADDPDAGRTRKLATVGGQIDFNFTFALRLPMVFSVGYAMGFERGERRRDEVMASLKIM